ncbi:MAG: hypothetical protein Q4A00_04455 [Flavobacteriaceae bacterium]|nr:hypothetical protein [Flavobacteriaceae bacterium]
MKNKNYKVVLLVLSCFGLYLAVSVIALVFDIKWEPLERVNLVSELFKTKEKNPETKEETKEITENLAGASKQDFNLYKKPEFITNFSVDETMAMPRLVKKLHQLKTTGKGKIRIAYFGDSMIEGDLMTQTFRKLLQQEFGGAGVGYLPMASNVAGFRQSATIKASGWADTHFMTKGANNLYISGHIFKNGSGSYRDNTIQDSINVEKSLIFGQADNAQISVNNNFVQLNGNHLVNRKVLVNDLEKSIRVEAQTSVPIYGVSFESENGVFVDNFSFRGITGVELNKIDEDFLKAIDEANHYDLIVFQYGVNLLFRPKDTNYSHYDKAIRPVFEKMKRAFSKSDFLLISTADRAFRYGGEYKSAIGIPNLVELQAKLALDNGFAFYNQFESMGGENSIIRWANEKPALANKDYIHPNHRGAEVLAEKLFNALMKDYKKYQSK